MVPHKDKVISKEVMLNNSNDQEKISLEHLDKTNNIVETQFQVKQLYPTAVVSRAPIEHDTC